MERYYFESCNFACLCLRLLCQIDLSHHLRMNNALLRRERLLAALPANDRRIQRRGGSSRRRCASGQGLIAVRVAAIASRTSSIAG